MLLLEKLQIYFDLLSFEESLSRDVMPIEINRVNRECPQCKNSTIFNTGKGYFCGKCLNTLEINQIAAKL